MAPLTAVTYLGILGLLALGVAPSGQSPEHPPVKTSDSGPSDSAICVECHADRASGQVVHAAVQAGCDTCHAVEKDDEETQVRLTLDGNDLCFTCHEDKKPQPNQVTLHSPVRRELCIVCHEPHSTQAPHLLRKGTESRLPAENLCLSCHGEIAAQIQKPVQHAAVDMGCSTCHTTHKSEPSNQPEGTFHLVEGQPALCLSCHDVAGAALKKAHSNQPFATSSCTECHNPHGSDRQKLINSFAHSPFVDGMCDVCHADTQGGNVVLVEGARQANCLSCHSDVEEKLSQTKIPHAALQLEPGCTGCHSPHAASYPHQLRLGPVRTCLTCHGDLAEAQASKQHLHRPVFEQSCAICHQPHGGERAGLLRAAPNDLCLACHGSQMRSTLAAGTNPKLFGGTVEVPINALRDIRLLPLAAGQTKNHPLGGHPVAGGPKEINCLSCHLPHAANGSPRLFVTESANSSTVCLKCH